MCRELITICWDPDPSKRPRYLLFILFEHFSFKEIITRLDNIIVDAAISDELGRSFWKSNFLQRVSFYKKEVNVKGRCTMDRI